MKKTITWMSAAFVAFLLWTLPSTAQQPSPTPQPAPQNAAFDVRNPPPPPSEELARQPQISSAKGDQQRHYYFAEAKTEFPYRIYVPQAYDGKTRLPLMLALHGAGGHQNYFFQASYGMPELMEKYGFIFVEPIGYDAFGAYGTANLQRVTYATDPKTTVNPINSRRPHWTPEEAQHVTELSEKDVMNVLALVEKEYAVDTSRVYIMGHSMGGVGTWYLGQKLPTSGRGSALCQADLATLITHCNGSREFRSSSLPEGGIPKCTENKHNRKQRGLKRPALISLISRLLTKRIWEVFPSISRK